MTNRLLDVFEVSQILHVSEAQVYLMIRRGDLPAVRIGRLRRVREEDLDQFVMNNVTNKSDQSFGDTFDWSNKVVNAHTEKEIYHE